jgi:hypothetical protein
MGRRCGRRRVTVEVWRWRREGGDRVRRRRKKKDALGESKPTQVMAQYDDLICLKIGR